MKSEEEAHSFLDHSGCLAWKPSAEPVTAFRETDSSAQDLSFCPPSF